MFHQNGSNLAKLVIIAAVVMTALIIVSGVATASSNCKKVEGKLTLNPDTTGSYKGDIKGNSVFSQTNFAFTDIPDVALLTGNNLIHTDDGDLMTQDAIVLRATGAGDFAEVDTVVGGTGRWAGATGVIQATGKFTFETGGKGNYSGQICTP
ncbi:MAG: hypothetical protein U0401_18295 [Anaerolineae bacterium]